MKVKRLRSSRRFWIITGGIVVVLLAALVFTLGSLNVPLNPEQGNDFVVFFAVSTLLAAALLVFSLILTRSLVRLWAERRSGQLGSRFKVKMVLGAMGISLLPVVFLFFFSYALVNRTLNRVVSAAAGARQRAKPEADADDLETRFERLNGLRSGRAERRSAERCRGWHCCGATGFGLRMRPSELPRCI